MKNHLKRIAAPRSWLLDRKAETFTIRPRPSGHSFTKGIPLGIVLRDHLHLADTLTEVKKLLQRHSIEVDGQRRKDPHFFLGLFDVLAIPSLKKAYLVTYDLKGRVVVVPHTAIGYKVCKILSKRLVRGGKTQFGFHDGKHILRSEKTNDKKINDKNINDEKINVGDSVIIALPEGTLQKVIPLTPGATVYLLQGKHLGDMGILQAIQGQLVTYTKEGKSLETKKEYVFALPADYELVLARHSAGHPSAKKRIGGGSHG